MSGDVNLDAVAETETVELDPATEIERLAAFDLDIHFRLDQPVDHYGRGRPDVGKESAGAQSPHSGPIGRINRWSGKPMG